MGLLDGDLAASIYAGFKGKLKSGVLRQEAGLPSSGALDAYGDPVDPPAPAEYPIEGFTDNYSAFVRANAGIPDNDVIVCFFGSQLPAGVVPARDNLVRLGLQWFHLRRTAVDPAGALWTCQASEVEAP